VVDLEIQVHSAQLLGPRIQERHRPQPDRIELLAPILPNLDEAFFRQALCNDPDIKAPRARLLNFLGNCLRGFKKGR
jgi:hypothetical protein